MTPGQHTLKAYHNNSDKNQVQPLIDISVDGVVVATGQKFTSSAQSTIEAGSSFITFNVTEGQPVVITYTTVLEDGKTYTNTRAILNGLEFDVAEMMATDPQPVSYDFHAGSEDGTIPDSMVEMLGKTEHVRWNVEQLLTRFRPLTEEEQAAVLAGKATKDGLKREKFAHLDIVSCDRLARIDPEAVPWDSMLVRNIPGIYRRLKNYFND